MATSGGYKTVSTRKIAKAEEHTAVTDREYSDIEEKRILVMINDLKDQMSQDDTKRKKPDNTRWHQTKETGCHQMTPNERNRMSPDDTEWKKLVNIY